MANLTLEIYYNGQPVQKVPEEVEVELCLANRGEIALENLVLSLGAEKLRAMFSLAPGATILMPYRVQDLAGRLLFQVRDSQQTLTEARLEVYPRKISQKELDWIKYSRLPHLLAHLDAKNTVLLTYNEYSEDRIFTYTSLDFTAQKLRQFCHLLTEGLIEDLTQRLDYQVVERPRRETGEIRGNIRWNPTVQGWLNSPAETGLTHHWVEAPTDYATRPNLLLVFWLKELIYENRKLVWQVETTHQASGQLVKGLAEFKEYAGRFENFLKYEKNLQPVLERLMEGFNPRDPAERAEILVECRRSPNPAYFHLAEAFEEYLRRYIRLPEEGEEAGIQPLSVIYEWWAACEIAAALDLTFKTGEQGRQSGTFANTRDILYYNQAAPGGWYSAGRVQPARPDLRLKPGSGRQIFLDVKYRTAPGDPTRANPEDMYRMLAYMNDFDVQTGVIIFPGAPAATPQLRLIDRPAGLNAARPAEVAVNESANSPSYSARLAELSLRPPASNEPEVLSRWEASLKESLTRLQERL